MSGTRLKHSLAIIAVAAAGVIVYNGHAGLGAYQHNQTDPEFLAAAIQDGTSNTIVFGARAPDHILMADMGGQF
jgi:hypothetical protein